MTERRLFDRVRRKSVLALPEEQVRQALIQWLLGTIGVPKNLVSVEYSLSALDPTCRQRADLVVWKPGETRSGLKPWLLAECKAPAVVIDDSVADQVRRYAVRIQAEHVLLTNGDTTRTFRLADGNYGEIASLPLYAAG